MSDGEKPRKPCPLCGDTFADASGVRRHTKRKHPEAVDTPAAEQAEEAERPTPAADVIEAEIVEVTDAGSVSEGDSLIILGVTRTVTEVTSAGKGIVRLRVSGSSYFETPAHTRVQRIEK